MRTDMFKVIVERPRRWKNLCGVTRSGRDDLDAPMFLGMRRGYGHRYLNENLAPLRRFLESQVRRPWNKVYSEICETIDTRSTVKQHILQHVDDFVATHTWVKDDQLWCLSKHWSQPMPLSDAWQRLYVDPRTGILRKNIARDKRNTQLRKDRISKVVQAASHRRNISEHCLLLRIEGIWYEVNVNSLRKIPGGKPCEQKDWCVVRKALVSMENADSFNGSKELGNRHLFGKSDLYATSKFQLNKAELKKFELVN